MTTKQLFQFWGLAVVVISVAVCMAVGSRGWIIPVVLGASNFGTLVSVSLLMHLANKTKP